MPVFKEVFQFVTNDGGKWNEVWYESASTLAVASTFPQSFLAKRLQLLDQNSTFQQIRVSDTANPRSTNVVIVNQTGNGLVDNPLPANAAAVCILNSTNPPHRRKWFCRGLNQGQIFRSTSTGVDTISASFRANLSSWFSALQASGYVIYALQTLASAGLKYHQIQSVDGTAKNGVSIVTTADPHLLAVGDLVVIGRCSKKDLPVFNGRFTVLAVTSNTFNIAYQTPEGALVTTTTGRVRKAVFDLNSTIQANLCSWQAYLSRRSKNAFTNSRGARSASRGLRAAL
jgi:hypothetical protein